MEAGIGPSPPRVRLDADLAAAPLPARRILPPPVSRAPIERGTLLRRTSLPKISTSAELDALRLRGPATSFVIHLTVLAGLLATSMLRLAPPPPPESPTVDLVLGTGAATTGQPSPAPKPVPPVPAAAATVPAPPQPTAPPLPQAPQAPPSPQAPPAPPSPQAPPAPPAPQAPPAPPAPATQRASPPPDQQGTVAAAPAAAPPVPQPAPSSPPPPTTTAVAQRQAPSAASDMSVSLGDGVANPAAEIENAGLIHPAQADTGNIAPTYPLDAARRRETGTVLLSLLIAPDGHVRDVVILQSSGVASLDNAARDRLATWHFRPATRDGNPVDDSIEFEIHFSK